MFKYQTIKNYQKNLDLALNSDNIDEIKKLITPVADLINIYKRKMGSWGDNSKYILVGKLTTKNEIIFNEPKRDSVDLSNVSSYYPFWVPEEDGKPSTTHHIGELEIRNYRDLVQIKNPIDLNGEDSYGDIGYMTGSYKEVKVVFYDQYLEE